MPMDRSRYPANWDEISRSIRERAGDKCEWCGVANGSIGARDQHGHWHDQVVIESLNSSVGESLFDGEFPDMVRIVLTVAHTDDPDPMNCAPGNLAALCQRCHLNHDRPHHIEKARETRRRHWLERTGQQEMPL